MYTYRIVTKMLTLLSYSNNYSLNQLLVIIINVICHKNTLFIPIHF